MGRVRRPFIENTLGEHGSFILFSAVLFLGAIVGVAWPAGYHAVQVRLLHVEPLWLAAAAGLQVVAYLGYTIAYREVSLVEAGPGFRPRHLLAAVATGFGAFVARGGFHVDLHAFRQTGVNDREARVRVLGLGALEYAALAPAACVCAIVLLVSGADQPSWGFTLPWAIAVPLGFVAAAVALGHRARFENARGWRDLCAQAIDSIHVLRRLACLEHMGGFVGTLVYWAADIATLWACIEAFGGHADHVAALVVGYATGYALTRRTLPLGGAGAVEALLPFALFWAGFSLPTAVVAVFAYRVLNLWLPLVPAALGLRELRRVGASAA
jgi:uncharacterized membrane protein YbhN (UPF0104 family)